MDTVYSCICLLSLFVFAVNGGYSGTKVTELGHNSPDPEPNWPLGYIVSDPLFSLHSFFGSGGKPEPGLGSRASTRHRPSDLSPYEPSKSSANNDESWYHQTPVKTVQPRGDSYGTRCECNTINPSPRPPPIYSPPPTPPPSPAYKGRDGGVKGGGGGVKGGGGESPDVKGRPVEFDDEPFEYRRVDVDQADEDDADSDRDRDRDGGGDGNENGAGDRDDDRQGNGGDRDGDIDQDVDDGDIGVGDNPDIGFGEDGTDEDSTARFEDNDDEVNQVSESRRTRNQRIRVRDEDMEHICQSYREPERPQGQRSNQYFSFRIENDRAVADSGALQTRERENLRDSYRPKSSRLSRARKYGSKSSGQKRKQVKAKTRRRSKYYSAKKSDTRRAKSGRLNPRNY